MSSMENENNGDNDEIVDSEKEDSAEEFNSDSSSDEYMSSDLECEDSEKDKEYNCILSDIEKQFNLVRQIYKTEKNYEIDRKTSQILDESAPEYLQPLNELIENKKVRIEIAELIRNYRINNLNQFYNAEKLAAEQNYKNEKELLKDSIKKDIEEKICKLNEERYKADSEFFSETHHLKKPRKYSYSDDYNHEKRRKTVTISGPFIIHRLKDEEIMEDVNFIKCCLRSQKNNYNMHHF